MLITKKLLPAILLSALMPVAAQAASHGSSPQGRYTVTATINVKPGTDEQFLQVIKSVAAATKSDPGVLSYKVYRQATCTDSPAGTQGKTVAGVACGDKLTFVNLEIYASEAAFEAHMKQPYVVKALKDLGPMIDHMDIHGLEPAF